MLRALVALLMMTTMSMAVEQRVPQNSAIITMVNAFHINFIYYQLRVLRHRGIFEQLVNSFYVVTLDLESYEKCTFFKIKHCIKGSTNKIVDSEMSNFKMGNYHNIIFSKVHTVNTHVLVLIHAVLSLYSYGMYLVMPLKVARHKAGFAKFRLCLFLRW